MGRYIELYTSVISKPIFFKNKFICEDFAYSNPPMALYNDNASYLIKPAYKRDSLVYTSTSLVSTLVTVA